VPNLKGFDDWFGFLNQDHAVDYYTDYLWRDGRKEIIKGNLNGGRREYAQDLFTREAVRFINAHRSRPFFLYLAYTTPHETHEVPDLEPYAGKPWTTQQKTYAAMVTRMDRNIGRIMDLLKRNGLDDNTLVIFASDNGAPNKKDVDFFRGTLGFRAAKGAVYEGGIRVPGIARWPGKVPAGKTSDFAWAFWDFLPTAAELAGVPAPKGIDGISIVPALMGKRRQPHEYLYWEAYGRGAGFRQGIRMGKWKGVREGLAGKLELYDLALDPGEKHDLAAQNPGVVAQITEKLRGVRTDNPDYPVDRQPARPKGSG
jgi:arylsulfatase A-like enzyme